MFGKTPKIVATKLDPVIERILTDMDTYGPDSPEYPTLLSYLERTTTLQKSQDRTRVDANTMAIVAGNLMGILVIVAYERMHVMTSKSLGFVLKAKN